MFMALSDRNILNVICFNRDVRFYIHIYKKLYYLYNNKVFIC